MGANLRLRTFHDLLKHGFHLGVECPSCGHSAIYAVQGMVQWFTFKKRSVVLEAAGTYFRCEKCQHKGALLRPVAPYKAPDLPPPQPSRYTLKERARRERG